VNHVHPQGRIGLEFFDAAPIDVDRGGGHEHRLLGIMDARPDDFLHGIEDALKPLLAVAEAFLHIVIPIQLIQVAGEQVR
jgi:hypothetical protein